MRVAIDGVRILLAAASLAIAVGSSVAASAQQQPRTPGQQPKATPIAENPALAEIAQRLPELVQVAALDPVLAANFVPADWIDLLVDATFSTAAEKASLPSQPDPPHEGAVGPWPTVRAFARSIEATDAHSVAALLDALGPRIAQRCRVRRVSHADFDRALRRVALDLGAPALIDRASGGRAAALTPTQRELARLGVPTLLVVRKQFRVLSTARWGAGWAD